TILVEYPAATVARAISASDAPLQLTRKTSTGELRVGCIGAGAFARGVIFPALRKTRGVVLHSVATASGTASESARRSFDFTRAASPADLLQDAGTDAVFVIYLHDSHAQYLIAALSNHKPVFVEKPLAINREQLEEILCAYEVDREKCLAPLLMMGFNRCY